MGAADRTNRTLGGLKGHAPAGLTDFQVTVANLFFSLPESNGFLLAGGAALAAQKLTTRPTQDLDLFTRAGGPSVPAARDAFEDAVRSRGWTVRRIRDGDTFCRLVLSGDEELLVDLAGRTVIALFDRAEARDLADVYVLAQRYEPELLPRLAAELDAELDLAVFASMLGSLERFTDAEIPVPTEGITDLRSFFATWRAHVA
jgi:hypothetical protein